MRSWGLRGKERLWFRSGMFVCQVDNGLIYYLVFVISQTRIIWEEGASIEKFMNLIGLWENLWDLVIDVGRPRSF